ncbi:Predicted nucleotide-binding protein containing TIR-like domain-containing protein [Burkholderia cepacia]|uniref:TIR domain-containing protein n=1 Tax=Burkholderia cepacia TaxID=292 RepID=UPI0008CECA6F|nr:nucleotide-binding protein [Burkholderia cepacia]SEU36451.1 Predicted nucleotide-binding protein containing TIR-like domain-containing protein [Burkholderia cepacia]
MATVAVVMAKLAGIRKAIDAALSEKVNIQRGGGSLQAHFAPKNVGHQFHQAVALIDELRDQLPDLYADFQQLEAEPATEMAKATPDSPPNLWYSRRQLEKLCRDIDQVFEIRANSELAQPAVQAVRAKVHRVFISHGRSTDWREVQAYIEKDIGIATIELAQEANAGQTIIEKLENNASNCDSAVIVMTGDDTDAEGVPRARENVMHEIGFFQAKYGRSQVCLLHEEGVSIPTNLSGVVYIPFPKGNIAASFGVLVRELKAIYKL